MSRRNSKGQFVKGGRRGGGESRSRSKRSNRRGTSGHSLKVEDAVAGALLLLVLNTPSSDGSSTVSTAASQGLGAAGSRVVDAVVSAKDIAGGDPYWAPTEELASAAVAVKAIGWAARKLGHRSKHSLKIGKHVIRA